MKLTVAICTWNRADILDRTLAQMRQLVVPPDVEWELLVVNNNCTDHTDSILTRHDGVLPLRRIAEPTAGKSFALNRAAIEARGDVIVWTDDDVLVDPMWLAEYARAIERWPAMSFFGGPAQPWFETTPPSWLKEVFQQVAGVYALVDFGSESIVFDTRRVPYGLNMAVRTDLQRRYPYDENLGPTPGKRMHGEETSLIRRMMKDGHQGRYVPGARLQHLIPTERQTVSYIRDWYAGQGHVLTLGSPRVKVPMLMGRPRWLWKKIVSSELSYRYLRLVAPPHKWIEGLKENGHLRGVWRTFT